MVKLMRKDFLLRAILAVLGIILVFFAGLFVGINFSSVRALLYQNSIAKVSESSGGASDFETKGTDEGFEVKPIEEVIELVYGNALNRKSKQELLESAINGIISSLGDKYAEYFSKEEYKLVMESYGGTMSGIGVIVTLDSQDRVVIVKVIEDTPAYRAGLREGDIIEKVEEENTKSMPLEKVVALIKGEEGTKVKLGIYRPDEDIRFEVEITREKFYVPNLFSEMLDDSIGYIQYINFQEGGAERLDTEIQKLISGGAKGIIFDLRNNLGGTLDDAVKVCDLFLDEGVIVTIKGRSEDKEKVDEYTAEKGKYVEIPLIVLINEFSASASELTAGALKDNNRAILIGEKSFGKGTVQVLHELSDGSGIKFTTAKYYLPSGISVEGSGIVPDIVVEQEWDAREDLQLNRAVQEMKSLIEALAK